MSAIGTVMKVSTERSLLLPACLTQVTLHTAQLPWLLSKPLTTATSPSTRPAGSDEVYGRLQRSACRPVSRQPFKDLEDQMCALTAGGYQERARDPSMSWV